jgi:hypothetical protein
VAWDSSEGEKKSRPLDRRGVGRRIAARFTARSVWMSLSKSGKGALRATRHDGGRQCGQERCGGVRVTRKGRKGKREKGREKGNVKRAKGKGTEGTKGSRAEVGGRGRTQLWQAETLKRTEGSGRANGTWQRGRKLRSSSAATSSAARGEDLSQRLRRRY